MATGQVQVTFSGPVSFLTSELWINLRASLQARLPLRNLHWKSPTRPSIRTIQELDLELVPLESRLETHSSPVPTSVLERPLLNLYFISCEDNDTYKNIARKQIKDWLSLISLRRHQEWLVVLVSRPDAQTGKRIFQRGNVLDKIKADFNFEKKDRCAQLNWTTGSEDPAAWTDMLSKMKEGVIASFDTNITLREEEVKRSEMQRQMPGWSFCTFFVLKESLVTSFEGMNLLEDAQMQYDELEASFFQVAKEKGKNPFPIMGATADNDDSAPLLSTTKKPYKQLIHTNSISFFDFRIYVLGRQCTILAKRHRFVELAKKAAWFVPTFGKTLKQHESELGEYFVESWIYSSALNIVDHCEQWTLKVDMDPASQSALNGVKGELIELARSQLDKIGVRVGHLPRSEPFAIPSKSKPQVDLDTPATSPSPSPPPTRLSRKDLIEAISDQDAFDNLYIILTNRAIEYYTGSGRRRFVLKLHGSLAALDRHRGRYPNALSTFASLPAHYVPTHWLSLEGFMLARSLDCHAKMNHGKGRDTEWIGLVLGFLKTFVGMKDGGKRDSVLLRPAIASQFDLTSGGTPKGHAYLRELVTGVRDAAAQLDKDFLVSNYPPFSVRLSSEWARSSPEEDGSFLDVIVNNSLPCDISVDSVTVSVISKDQFRFRFTSLKPSALASGATRISLFCPDPISGSFLVDMHEIRLGRVSLQYPRRSNSPSIESLPRNDGPPIVKVPSDFAALGIRLGFPRHIKLDETRKLLLQVSSGRNSVRNIKISLSDATSRIKFLFQNASVTDEGIHLTREDEYVSLQSLGADTVTDVEIPFEGALDGESILLVAEYTTKTAPEVTRTVRRLRKLSGALPLVVNVSDYFRDKRLISRFTVSSDGTRHLRVADARLEGASPTLKLSTYPLNATNGLYVNPESPANFLFTLDSTAEEPRKEREFVQFVVVYRTIYKELEILVTRHVKKLLQEDRRKHLSEFTDWFVQVFMFALSDENLWAETYGMTGKLDFGDSEAPGSSGTSVWKDVVRKGLEELGKSDEQQASLQDQLEGVLKAVAKNLNSEEQPKLLLDERTEEWQTLTLPVDVPFMNIINYVRITIPSRSKTDSHTLIYAGQPVAAVCTINTSFHWGAMLDASGNVKRSYRMRFDISADLSGTWLLSGPKRGDFVAQDGSTHTINLTLVPLRHGSLSLPAVRAVPVSDTLKNSKSTEEPPSCETYQIHAGVTIDVLPRSLRSSYMIGLPDPVAEGHDELMMDV